MERVAITYFNFGDKYFAVSENGILSFLRELLPTKRMGRRENAETAEATKMIVLMDKASFQNKRSAKREPIIAPDVSIA